MNNRNLLMTAAVLALVLTCGSDAFARGGGRGGAGGKGLQSQSRSSGQTGSCTGIQSGQVRPADSQRRDGTFMQTGVTASGSGTRPANGRGVMDGTGINAARTVE